MLQAPGIKSAPLEHVHVASAKMVRESRVTLGGACPHRSETPPSSDYGTMPVSPIVRGFEMTWKMTRTAKATANAT